LTHSTQNSKMASKNAFIFIFITIVIDSTGLGIIIPSLPSLVAEVAHVSIDDSANYYGLILGSYAFMQFLFSPIIGSLSDKYGRRPILLMSLFGLGIDYVFMYFAPSLVWLVIGRCLSGMFGASFTTASAYIADISTPENKTRNFGMVGAAFGIGFIIGPAIGGLLGNFDIRAPFLFAAGLSLLNLIYGTIVLKESLSLENRREFSWKQANPVGAFFDLKKYKSFALVFVVLFLLYMGGMAIHSTWNYYTIEKFQWNINDVGLSLAAVGVCIAIVQGGLAGKISAKFGNEKTALISMGLTFITMNAIAFATHSWMLYLFMLPYAFSGLSDPAIRAIMSNKTSESEQGELQGVITSILSIAEIIGPPLMMVIFHFSARLKEPMYGMPFIVGSIFILSAVFLFRRIVSTK
jgi:DHA1 family tetracycline resistance protein-like MFS transporter